VSFCPVAYGKTHDWPLPSVSPTIRVQSNEPLRLFADPRLGAHPFKSGATHPIIEIKVPTIDKVRLPGL
jgi:hypothetical protein